MAEDKREQILVRLQAILTELAGDTGIKVYRDRSEFDHEELPAYVLLDGTEVTEIKSSDRRGPQIMGLMPQIFYVPNPTENPLNTGVGPDLSAKRVALMKAIMRDDRLSTLLGDNGYIEYRSMETDMQAAADEVKGRFRLDFVFAYVLNFNKL